VASDVDLVTPHPEGTRLTFWFGRAGPSRAEPAGGAGVPCSFYGWACSRFEYSGLRERLDPGSRRTIKWISKARAAAKWPVGLQNSDTGHAATRSYS
jgi:hypothetical protein